MGLDMSTPQEKLFIKTVTHRSANKKLGNSLARKWAHLTVWGTLTLRETKLAAVMFVKDNGLAKSTNSL